MSVPITLLCPTCGKEQGLIITRQILFGFELCKIAKDAGWYPIIDFNYNRTIVFCHEDCYKKQLTKKGTIRRRLIRASKEVTNGLETT